MRSGPYSVRRALIGEIAAARPAGMMATKNAHPASDPAATVRAKGPRQKRLEIAGRRVGDQHDPLDEMGQPLDQHHLVILVVESIRRFIIGISFGQDKEMIPMARVLVLTLSFACTCE